MNKKGWGSHALIGKVYGPPPHTKANDPTERKGKTMIADKFSTKARAIIAGWLLVPIAVLVTFFAPTLIFAPAANAAERQMCKYEKGYGGVWQYYCYYDCNGWEEFWGCKDGWRYA
jgi:hypothetical protein